MLLNIIFGIAYILILYDTETLCNFEGYYADNSSQMRSPHSVQLTEDSVFIIEMNESYEVGDTIYLFSSEFIEK